MGEVGLYFYLSYIRGPWIEKLHINLDIGQNYWIMKLNYRLEMD